MPRFSRHPLAPFRATSADLTPVPTVVAGPLTPAQGRRGAEEPASVPEVVPVGLGGVLHGLWPRLLQDRRQLYVRLWVLQGALRPPRQGGDPRGQGGTVPVIATDSDRPLTRAHNAPATSLSQHLFLSFGHIQPRDVLSTGDLVLMKDPRDDGRVSSQASLIFICLRLHPAVDTDPSAFANLLSHLDAGLVAREKDRCTAWRSGRLRLGRQRVARARLSRGLGDGR